jgi:hypothetical protein
MTARDAEKWVGTLVLRHRLSLTLPGCEKFREKMVKSVYGVTLSHLALNRLLERLDKVRQSAALC